MVPAIHDKTSGSWHSTSWRDYNSATRAFAKSLLHLDFKPGQAVAILGANRSEWVISALGAMRVGGISAGIYTTSSVEEIGYILAHSDAPLIVVETLEQLDKVLEVWSGEVATLQHVVLMQGAGEHDDPRVLGWSEFLALGDDIEEARIDEALEALKPGQVADFIYTSGTTGPPKAVMLTHENLEWTAAQLSGAVDLANSEIALSYLPLSHIAEQTASILMALTAGYEVYFCHDGLQLLDYLKEVRPTIFFGVPRVWERFEAGIKDRLAEATGAKATIATAARDVASRYIAETNAGRTPSRLLDAKYQAANKVVLSKMHSALGFDRCRVIVSGAAPIPASTLEFFASIGMPILELYGQSEDSGPTTTNLPGANRYGTVGKALPGVEVKVAEDGEILVRGKNVFAGYYKNQAATDEALVDGWLHSGDLGRMDDDGYLSIIGRKKDIIITSGGKNVAPQNIEEALSGIDIVGTAVVCGDQQRFLISLLTLDPEAAARFAEERGLDTATMHEDPAVRNYITDRITEQVNPQLARVEQVRNFKILPNEFTTATGELTPTLKVKRNVVNDMYASDIAETFAAGQEM